jgi:hypothetical protein
MVCESYKDLVCSITQQLLDEAVMTADGHLYSEAALRTWLRDKRIFTSPRTGLVLENNQENTKLKAMLRKMRCFMDECTE